MFFVVLETTIISGLKVVLVLLEFQPIDQVHKELPVPACRHAPCCRILVPEALAALLPSQKELVVFCTRVQLRIPFLMASAIGLTPDFGTRCSGQGAQDVIECSLL